MNTKSPLKAQLMALAASTLVIGSAYADAVAPTATLTQPLDFRIVAGTSPTQLTYTIDDINNSTQSLDFSILPYTLG